MVKLMSDDLCVDWWGIMGSLWVFEVGKEAFGLWFVPQVWELCCKAKENSRKAENWALRREMWSRRLTWDLGKCDWIWVRCWNCVVKLKFGLWGWNFASKQDLGFKCGIWPWSLRFGLWRQVSWLGRGWGHGQMNRCRKGKFALWKSIGHRSLCGWAQ